jgi:hypothetical protein
LSIMRIRAALVCAVIATCSACTSDEPAPSPLPITTTPTATPPTSAPAATTPRSTAAPSPPVQPALARQDSPAGAEAFARYWLTALDYASTTGDTKPLRRLGSCAACTALARGINSLYTSGGRAEGGKITVVGSSTASHMPRSAALVRVDYDQGAGREIRPGKPIVSSPGANNLAFAFTLSRTAAGWQVIKVQPIKED